MNEKPFQELADASEADDSAQVSLRYKDPRHLNQSTQTSNTVAMDNVKGLDFNVSHHKIIIIEPLHLLHKFLLSPNRLN